MTQLFATGDGTLAFLAAATGWLAAGGLIGAFHFLTLRTTARMLAAGSSVGAALAFHLMRFAVTAGALVLITRHGAVPLIAATLGILMMRTMVVRLVSRKIDASPVRP